MNKFIVLPYSSKSKSAKSLATSLGCRRLSLTKQRYPGYSSQVIINWGSRKLSVGQGREVFRRAKSVLNHPRFVSNASNKLTTFNLLKSEGVPTPDFTTSRNKAYRWLEETEVFSRVKLSSNSGNGIIVNKPEGYWVEPAPLYTKAFKKTAEYRVHVLKDKLICIQQKKLKRADGRTREPDEYIWNHSKGQRVFVRNSVEYSERLTKERLTELASKAVKALDLDFGACDIGYDEGTDSLIVFEVNTAAGLEGTTLTDYTEAFEEWYNEAFN